MSELAELRRVIVADAPSKHRTYAVFFIGCQQLHPGSCAIAVSVKAGPHPTEWICDSSLVAGSEHQAHCAQHEFGIVSLLAEQVVGAVAQCFFVCLIPAEEEFAELRFGRIPIKLCLLYTSPSPRDS